MKAHHVPLAFISFSVGFCIGYGFQYLSLDAFKNETELICFLHSDAKN